jgi:hypothetical protein
VNAHDRCPTKLAVHGGSVVLSDDLLGRLLHALARMDSHGAGTVREEIAALRLAGGEIRLVPTEAELASVRLALASLATASRPLAPALSELEALCSHQGAPPVRERS